MDYIKLISAIALALLMCSCAATSGNTKMADQTQDSVSKLIVEGKTTKADLTTRLGDPTITSYTDSGNEVWTYQHVRASAQAINYVPVANWFVRGFDTTTKRLVVFLDKNGVVQKYTMAETQGESAAGLGK